jgi:hypothetical protein
VDGQGLETVEKTVTAGHSGGHGIAREGKSKQASSERYQASIRRKWNNNQHDATEAEVQPEQVAHPREFPDGVAQEFVPALARSLQVLTLAVSMSSEPQPHQRERDDPRNQLLMACASTNPLPAGGKGLSWH